MRKASLEAQGPDFNSFYDGVVSGKEWGYFLSRDPNSWKEYAAERVAPYLASLNLSFYQKVVSFWGLFHRGQKVGLEIAKK